MSKLQGFFNGFGLYFPTPASAEDIFKMLDDDEAKMTLSDEEYVKELKALWLALRLANETHIPRDSSGGVLQQDLVKQACVALNIESTSFYTNWFSNIRYLVKKGVLNDDDDNGFVYSKTPLCDDVPRDVKFFGTDFTPSQENIARGISQLAFKLAVKKTNDDLKNKPCNVCKIKSSKICSKCKGVFYCSVEHQVLDWKEHKKWCKKSTSSK